MARNPSNKTSGSKENDLEQRVALLEAKNKKLRKKLKHARQCRSPSPERTIPKPRGSAGDGFKLSNEMGLSDDHPQYKRIQRTVRSLVIQAGLDPLKKWKKQPRVAVNRLFTVARQRQPYLGRFENDWATEAFAMTYLKNRRAYLKRLGETDGERGDGDEALGESGDGSDAADGPEGDD